jgi:hypothetical protein
MDERLYGDVESQHDSCVLIVANRVVARADAGPLEAELALFDAECIELRTTDPGAVREAGYRTTASDARERLEALGITADLAELTAQSMARMAEAYARGPVVRRAVAALGAAEMFDGSVYISAARAYEGLWLDLAGMTFDLGDPELARALQAMHLAALLSEVPADADVYLSTLCLTQNQRPGVRTYRRVTFGDVTKWPRLVAAFAETPPATGPREAGPTRVEVLDWLQARSGSALTSARDRAMRIERSIATTPRPPPSRGPLSDPVAWSIESQLDAGEVGAALARIDAMERDRGSNPCVVYLRSRASLLLKREDPRVIAERVSSLASSASFDELELLAAQAWAAAGNMGRALPYARVLASNPRAPDELRTRARRLVDIAESVRPARGPSGKRTTNEPFTMGSEAPDLEPPTSRPAPTPRRSVSPLPAVLATARQSEMRSEPASETRLSAPASQPPKRRMSRSHRARKDERDITTMPPPAETQPDAPPATLKNNQTFAKGISRPAFRAVSTNSTPPRLTLGKLEIAETFDDPKPPASRSDERVRAAFDARMQSTVMSRELGMLYRTQLGIELRNDLASLEALQAELVARYHDSGVRTVSAMLDLRRHGAFLSEMIARSLNATWLDVSPAELGHWTMFVPPDTRVWPFARVLRFVTMASKERDLVAYFLELHTRSC